MGETLSSSDITGRLLPVVPAGISFPVGPVDPAGPNGPYVAGGPVGPYGTLSPSDSDPAGPAGPYVAGGPVGPDGTLSQFFSDPAGLAGLAGGPVGPYGTLSPSDSDPAGWLARMLQGGLLAQKGRCPRFSLSLLARLALQVALLARMGRCPRSNLILLAQMARMFQVTLFGTLSPSKSGSAILVDHGGVFPLSDPPPGGTLPPDEEGLPSCPDGVETPGMVAMMGMDAWSIEKDMFADGYSDTERIAVDGFRCEIVDGMRVYYDNRFVRFG